MEELSRLVVSLTPVQSSSSIPSVPGARGAPASPPEQLGLGSQPGAAARVGLPLPSPPLKHPGEQFTPGGNRANLGTHFAPTLPFSGHKDGAEGASSHTSFSLQLPHLLPTVHMGQGVAATPWHISHGLSTLQTTLARLPPAVTALLMVAGFLVSAQQREELPALVRTRTSG